MTEPQSSQLECREIDLGNGFRRKEYGSPCADPLVSVTMITFNHGPYIAQAIEGVVNQKADFPFELLLHDDASTDGTADICLEYARKYPHVIRLIVQEENQYSQGVRVSTDFQFSRARGEFLAFCEGDDYWHDMDKLQSQIDIFRSRPGVVLVHTDIDFLYEDRQICHHNFRRRLKLTWEDGVSRQDRYEQIMFGNNPCYTPSIVVRSDALMDVIRSDSRVFGTGEFPMGDTPCWAELALRGEFAYLDRSTATLRRLAESVSRSRDWRKLAKYSLGALRLRAYYAEKYTCDPQKRDAAMQRIGTTALRRACLGQDSATANEILAIMSAPTWRHRLLCAIAGRKLWARVYRGLDHVAIAIRRQYRKARFGIESSR